MKTNQILPVILAAVVAAGAGFFTGSWYQAKKVPAGFRAFRAGQGQMPPGQFMGNRQGFRPVAGEITTVDDKSLTVKLVDGSSKIVILSDKTEINQAQKVDRTQLT